LKNVRSEERNTYEQELADLRQANRMLSVDNENLKKQLINAYSCLYSSRNGIIGENLTDTLTEERRSLKQVSQ
jgi:hypothetical protein